MLFYSWPLRNFFASCMAYSHNAQMLAKLNGLGIDPTLFATFEQATLLLNFLEPQPQRNNRLPQKNLFLGDERYRNLAFGTLYSLFYITVGRRQRELLDDEPTRMEVLTQIRLCHLSSFSDRWLDDLEEFLTNGEYTIQAVNEAVAAADSCSHLVTECEFRLKQAEDRLSVANIDQLSSFSNLDII